MAQVKQPLCQSHLQPPRRQGLENQDEHGRLLSVNSASCLWPQDALWLVPTYRGAGETGARPPISLERVAPSRQPSGHSLWRGSPPHHQDTRRHPKTWVEAEGPKRCKCQLAEQSGGEPTSRWAWRGARPELLRKQALQPADHSSVLLSRGEPGGPAGRGLLRSWAVLLA